MAEIIYCSHDTIGEYYYYLLYLKILKYKYSAIIGIIDLYSYAWVESSQTIETK